VAGEFTKLVLRECWTPCTIEVLRLWAYEWEGFRSRAPSGLELLLVLPGMAMPGALVRDDMRPRVTLGSREGAACRACACECEAAGSGTNVSKASQAQQAALMDVQISSAMTPQRAGSFKRALSGCQHPTEIPTNLASTGLKAASQRQEKSQLTHGHSWADEEIVIWVDRRDIVSACGRGERRLPLGHRRVHRPLWPGASRS
jgi:hypothetical protein